MQEVEEDPELQRSVNMYRKSIPDAKSAAPEGSDEEGELPALMNLMEDINLADAIELNEREEEEDGDTPVDFTSPESKPMQH